MNALSANDPRVRIGDFATQWARRRPDPEWFSHVVPGSVLRSRNGVLRVVRTVSRSRTGLLWGVHLVIRRRSWTRRCYTVLIASDLKTLGYTMIPNVRVKPKTLLDVRIQQAIDQPSDQRPYIATADDVVGVA